MAFDTSSDSVREIDQSQRIEQLFEHLQAPLFTAKKGKPVEVPTPLAPLADTHGHLTPLRHMHPAVAVARAALVGVRLLAVPVDPARADELEQIITNLLESIRICAHLFAPFMPQTSAEVLRRMSLEDEVDTCDLVAACAWGGLAGSVPVTKGNALFPRLGGKK